MLEPDAGPTCMSGSQRGAGQQWPAPTRQGQRSYYPLFCTVAQTGQVLDVWHRPGNVHDSNGARAFILACLNEIRQILPHVVLEVRMDCAFFSEEIVHALDALGIQYTISVPFERLTQLKSRSRSACSGTVPITT